MLRKRYSVVVLGEGGTSAAQRSEVSRHRGEREARAAAEEERERLGVVHGDRAARYRVIVERDGAVLDDGGPPAGRAAAPVPPGFDDPAPRVRRLTTGRAGDGGGDAPGADEGDTASAPVLDEAVLARFLDDDAAAGATAEHPVPAPAAGDTHPDAPDAPAPDAPAAPAATAPRERQRVRMPGHDDIPSGPVPEDVLRRFEEAIAREEHRRRGGAGDSPGP
jgi:hypothetical protein